MQSERLLVVMKARQLGQTWGALAWFLSEMLFSPIANVLLFSKRETEAKHLLERLTGMYDHLPQWMRDATPNSKPDSTLTWALSNGSVARAFPTNAGDSYTATHALADEFDLVDDQGRLINAVQPTIDAGGQLVLLSRVDKRRPQTEFKRIFQAARRGDNTWRAVFLPWSARPSRDEAWYETQRRDVFARTGALDALHEQYPATVEEALSAPSLDKRIPGAWLMACYPAQPPITAEGAPAITGLRVYHAPVQGRVYVMGADPAEGLPHSDNSALDVLDKETGEQCAQLAGKYEPDVFAGHIVTLSNWYNGANVLPERNNHGHAVILTLRARKDDGFPSERILRGTDMKRGWLTTSASKSLLYDDAAVAFREGDAVIHSEDTYLQLASIGGSSLSAPEGLKDDSATSFVLALRARVARRVGTSA